MPADRPRAWQYMGEDYTVHGAGFINSGDLYIARLPLTPDDIPLAPPVEVTAGVGEDGYCTSCNKERHRVRNETCLDCRVHYGTASQLDQLVARELADYHRAEVVPLLAVPPVEVTAEDVRAVVKDWLVILEDVEDDEWQTMAGDLNKRVAERRGAE